LEKEVARNVLILKLFLTHGLGYEKKNVTEMGSVANWE
jgi:hypothetical protein